MKIGENRKPTIPPMEPGTYMGVCVGIVDVGEQTSTFGTKTKTANKILFVIEFPSETIEVDGEQKPRQLSKEVTKTNSEKGTMKALISAWTGKEYTEEELIDFELLDLLMRPCMATVVLSANGNYSNNGSIVQFPKGFPEPKTETQPYSFDMEDWNDEQFAALPEWIQNKIKKSTQYQKFHAPDTTIEVKPTEGVCPI